MVALQELALSSVAGGAGEHQAGPVFGVPPYGWYHHTGCDLIFIYILKFDIKSYFFILEFRVGLFSCIFLWYEEDIFFSWFPGNNQQTGVLKMCQTGSMSQTVREEKEGEKNTQPFKSWFLWQNL